MNPALDAETVYLQFCEIFGYTPGSWKSIFEFVNMMGCNILKYDSQYNKDTLEKLKAYGGPHGKTLLLAYKTKRYSFRGYVTSHPRKLAAAFFYFYENFKELVWG